MANVILRDTTTANHRPISQYILLWLLVSRIGCTIRYRHALQHSLLRPYSQSRHRTILHTKRGKNRQLPHSECVCQFLCSFYPVETFCTFHAFQPILHETQKLLFDARLSTQPSRIPSRIGMAFLQMTNLINNNRL